MLRVADIEGQSLKEKVEHLIADWTRQQYYYVQIGNEECPYLILYHSCPDTEDERDRQYLYDRFTQKFLEFFLKDVEEFVIYD